MLVEQYFEFLGWSQFNHEITKPVIGIGSAGKLIPDLVLKGDKDLLVVEIKKPSCEITEKHEQQLVSYMKQLSLQVGILWGSKIEIYYNSSKEEPIKIYEIEFIPENKFGVELLGTLEKKDDFKEKLFDYCEQKYKIYLSKKDVEKNKESINYLCSENGEKYIRELLSIEYPQCVIDQLVIKVTTKNSEMTKNHTSPFISNISPKTEVHSHYIPPTNIFSFSQYPIIETHEQLLQEIKKKENETIQIYVKRIFNTIYESGLISEKEISRLHDKDYSKNTFNIAYPLLCDRENEMWYYGLKKYYVDKHLKEHYYLCSQWWKDLTNDYYDRITKWRIKMWYNTKSSLQHTN